MTTHVEPVSGKHGGTLARFPRLKDKTPNAAPEWHWRRVLAHLRAHAPNDKQGIRKAQKMLNRAADFQQ